MNFTSKLANNFFPAFAQREGRRGYRVLSAWQNGSEWLQNVCSRKKLKTHDIVYTCGLPCIPIMTPNLKGLSNTYAHRA